MIPVTILVGARIYFLLYGYGFEIFVVDVAVALCFVALFVQRTAPTTCPSPCNGSSNGLLGDRTVLTKSNRYSNIIYYSLSIDCYKLNLINKGYA